MAITDGVRITVDSAVLHKKAQDVSGKVSAMERSFEQMNSIIAGTQHYWIGEAGDMHRQLYQEGRAKVEEMLQRLKEHPKVLEEIAENSEEGERQVIVIAQELPGDTF